MPACPTSTTATGTMSVMKKGKEYPIYCRKPGTMEADEEVMLNVNEMAENYDYYEVSGLEVSPDNQWLSYGVDTLSRRMYDLYTKNLKNR